MREWVELPGPKTPDEEELHGPDEPVYTIGVAARLLGVTPQLLRALERENLVEPARTEKNIRLYSRNDLKQLQKICRLVRERGINIAGVKVILSMEARYLEGLDELKRMVSYQEQRRQNPPPGFPDEDLVGGQPVGRGSRKG